MSQKTTTEALDTKLEAYASSDYYPFHMPGHKRSPLPMPNPYTIDITEIDGFDDLHQSEGILKAAQQRAAALYDAGQSYYLVNGSTCGILTAIFAAVPQNGTLLMARNCHKSVYHAAYLRNLSTVYCNPCITRFGISGAVSPQEVEEKLSCHPSVNAVILTSPTYEGVVSDIGAIAQIVHKHGLPLIVDEAHGAHFGFHSAFPQTAVRCGADIVIQSMHKVLPSFTQTALLHLNTTDILPQTIEKYRSIFQTSSPSYILMAGMEKCTRLLSEEGSGLFSLYTHRLKSFYQEARTLKNLHIMDKYDFSASEIYSLDPSKILISAKKTTINGSMLSQVLLNRYHLQMEMVSGFYVLAMTSIMDREEGFFRLKEALFEIDGEISADIPEMRDYSFIARMYEAKEKRMELYQAVGLPVNEVSFDEAIGQVSANIVSLYPPGIPVLAPGEVIDAGFIKNVRKCRKLQLNLQGVADIINERIDVVKC